MNKKQKHTEKLRSIQSILHECQKLLISAERMIAELDSEGDAGVLKKEKVDAPELRAEAHDENGEAIEGVFNGREMEGHEGKTYPVPENYASKSRLVEGDRLKLTITREGRLIFKQTGPIPRETLKGFLHYAPEEDQYSVLAEGKSYKVLAAPIAYFKGEIGDEAVIAVPEGCDSTWAAVERVVKKKPQDAVEEPVVPRSRHGGLEEI